MFALSDVHKMAGDIDGAERLALKAFLLYGRKA